MHRMSRWTAGVFLATGIVLGGSLGVAAVTHAAPATEPAPPPGPSVQKKPSPPTAGKTPAMRVVISDGNVVRARVSG